jgi:large subunit ribosomal protein L6
MSRIGRTPIHMPSDVSAVVKDNVITVKGPLGTLSQDFNTVNVSVEGNVIKVTRPNDLNETKAKHGLYRALIANMVAGVKKVYTKGLEIQGVGYKASKEGKKLVLSIGLSHPVEIVEPDGIKIDCPTITEITVTGIDKQKVGQMASTIRGLKPVEPYHGYGVRYKGEVVVKKQGKAAAKGAKK